MIYTKYSLYVLTILLFFFTNANSQQLWSGDLVPTWGKKNWQGHDDLHAQTTIESKGDRIVITVRVKDDQIKFKNDTIHSDHIEVWLALPSNKYTDNPRNFYQSKELELTYWVLPQYKGNILKQALAKNPNGGPNTPYNVTNKKSLNWWFGVRHFGYLPGDNKIISYDDERSPFQDNQELNESIKARTHKINENEYEVTLDIPLENFGFVPREGLKEFRALVNVVDVDKSKQETLLSSSAKGKWGKVKTFNILTPKLPLTLDWSKLITGQDGNDYLLQKLPEYMIKNEFTWHSAYVGIEPGLKGNDLHSESMGEWLKPYEANIIKNKIDYTSRELGDHLIEKINNDIYIDREYAYESHTSLDAYFLLPDKTIGHLFSSGTWYLGRFSRGPCSGASRDFQMIGLYKNNKFTTYKLSETEGCRGSVELYPVSADGNSKTVGIASHDNDITVKHDKQKHRFSYTGYEHNFTLDYSQAGQDIVTVSKKKILRINSYINNAITKSKTPGELEAKLNKVDSLFDKDKVHEFRKGHISCYQTQDKKIWTIISKYASYRPCMHKTHLGDPYTQAKDKKAFVKEFVTTFFTSPDEGERRAAIIRFATDIASNESYRKKHPNIDGLGVDMLNYLTTEESDRPDINVSQSTGLWYMLLKHTRTYLPMTNKLLNGKETQILNQKVISSLVSEKKLAEVAYIVKNSIVDEPLLQGLYSKHHFHEELKAAIEVKAKSHGMTLDDPTISMFKRHDVTPDTIKEAIAAGVDIKSLRINGGNLLHYYAGVDHLEKPFIYLVEQKLFDLTEKNDLGNTALNIAFTYKSQGYGTNKSTTKKVKALIKAGAIKDNESFSETIYLALKRADTQWGVMKLEAFDAILTLKNFKLTGDYAAKAIAYAIHRYHEDIFMKLIGKGGDINQTHDNLTFLMNAVAHADSDTVKKLVQKGANTQVTNNQGYSACDYIGESAKQTNRAEELTSTLKCDKPSQRNVSILHSEEDWSDKDITVIGTNHSDNYLTYGPFQIFDFDTKSFTTLEPMNVTVYGFLSLSPDNTSLLYGDRKTNKIHKLSVTDRSTTIIDGYRRLPRWLTDTLIIYRNAQNQTCIMYDDATSRCNIKELENFYVYESTSDGSLLGAYKKSVGLLPSLDKKYRKLTSREEGYYIRTPIRMSPDNNLLAIAYKNSGYRNDGPPRKVSIFNRKTGKTKDLKMKGDPIDRQLKTHWSNDSKHLLVVHERGTKVKFAKLFNTTTGEYEEIKR